MFPQQRKIRTRPAVPKKPVKFVPQCVMCHPKTVTLQRFQTIPRDVCPDMQRQPVKQRKDRVRFTDKHDLCTLYPLGGYMCDDCLLNYEDSQWSRKSLSPSPHASKSLTYQQKVEEMEAVLLKQHVGYNNKTVNGAQVLATCDKMYTNDIRRRQIHTTTDLIGRLPQTTPKDFLWEESPFFAKDPQMPQRRVISIGYQIQPPNSGAILDSKPSPIHVVSRASTKPSSTPGVVSLQQDHLLPGRPAVHVRVPLPVPVIHSHNAGVVPVSLEGKLISTMKFTKADVLSKETMRAMFRENEVPDHTTVTRRVAHFGSTFWNRGVSGVWLELSPQS
ncbi:hypothetical protein V1264_004971 [Littorina saxatilis]|uniref:Uncharacterized protein n=2 Tax=Littorina saxatilis TaxID=31220 RepID=A0AAN9B601_9CAEN